MPLGRLGANHLDRGIHHFQKARQPHQGSRRSDRADKIVDLSARLLPDLQRRVFVMRQGIGELVGHKIFVGILRDEFAGQTDRAIRPFGGRRQTHRAAVSADDLAAFDRHGLAHHDLHGIAFDDADNSQSDAGISRRGFDDRLPFGQAAFAFGGFDHLDRNAVLDAARRIEPFELGEYLHFRIGRQRIDPNHRRRTDGVQNRFLCFHLILTNLTQSYLSPAATISAKSRTSPLVPRPMAFLQSGQAVTITSAPVASSSSATACARRTC